MSPLVVSRPRGRLQGCSQSIFRNTVAGIADPGVGCQPDPGSATPATTVKPKAGSEASSFTSDLGRWFDSGPEMGLGFGVRAGREWPGENGAGPCFVSSILYATAKDRGLTTECTDWKTDSGQ
jgi:hypothetical protein